MKTLHFIVAIVLLSLSSFSFACNESRAIAFESYAKSAKTKVIERMPSVVYKCNGKYVKKGLNQIRHFLRDRQDGHAEYSVSDAELGQLMDVLYEIHQELGVKGPVKVNGVDGGHRTAKTQRKLSGNPTAGKKSQHTHGAAVDFYIPGFDKFGKTNKCKRCLQHVYRVATKVLARHGKGGFGMYYNQLHIDVRGRTARWGANYKKMMGIK